MIIINNVMEHHLTTKMVLHIFCMLGMSNV